MKELEKDLRKAMFDAAERLEQAAADVRKAEEDFRLASDAHANHFARNNIGISEGEHQEVVSEFKNIAGMYCYECKRPVAYFKRRRPICSHDSDHDAGPMMPYPGDR